MVEPRLCTLELVTVEKLKFDKTSLVFNDFSFFLTPQLVIPLRPLYLFTSF